MRNILTIVENRDGIFQTLSFLLKQIMGFIEAVLQVKVKLNCFCESPYIGLQVLYCP